MGRRYPIVKIGGSDDTTTRVLSALVVVTVLLAAALFVAVTMMRGRDTYVSGPGPMLDSEVPIRHDDNKWDAFYAFFGRACRSSTTESRSPKF